MEALEQSGAGVSPVRAVTSGVNLPGRGMWLERLVAGEPATLSVVLHRHQEGVLLAALMPFLEAEGRIYCLDAGNRFDPYPLALAARARQLPPELFLERVLISRAATCHQMAAVIEEMLIPLARDLSPLSPAISPPTSPPQPPSPAGEGGALPSFTLERESFLVPPCSTPARSPHPPDPPLPQERGVVTVLGIDTLFLDEDIPLYERRYLFQRSLLGLKAIRSAGIGCLITHHPPAEETRPWLRMIRQTLNPQFVLEDPHHGQNHPHLHQLPRK